MSVLIKGMKMPAIELEWTIRHGADGKWYAIDTNAETSDGEWHEIIPVPPHGRLIDADAFLDDLLFPSKQFEQGMRELVGDAPTVIPAEPPKEKV